ncbi:MAG TPA: hypothetical protein DEQ32_13190 [Gammaproteobacteria bacterium]|nr:hypothetical protein [Gammaproteobacteria bacterium]|tara:strand:- start:146 stop:433 length:288 start_codon:yes stop_codon:yes gene_type:complete
MKTVIVFDTDDEEGMRNAFKIVDHLASQYLNQRLRAMTPSEIRFGRIEFIKMMRAFSKHITAVQKKDPKAEVNGLRFNKQYADKIWGEKRMEVLK